MKKLSIKLAMIALALFTINGLSAQDYSLNISNPSSTKVVIKEVNRVKIEAHDGNTIEFSNSKGSSKPDRAEGLKPLSARGEDNTGIGLNVQQSGDEVTVFQAARRAQGVFTIKVPKDVQIHIEHTGNWEGGKIEVEGISGELEISGRYNSVHLKDITGPALVNTVYGRVEAEFSSLSQSGPTSLVSVHSTVDVTMPSGSKADLVIKTPYGEAYSDMNIEFPSAGGDGMRKVSSTIEGKLNGGGVELYLKASYGNVFLRKK